MIDEKYNIDQVEEAVSGVRSGRVEQPEQDWTLEEERAIVHVEHPSA